MSRREFDSHGSDMTYEETSTTLYPLQAKLWKTGQMPTFQGCDIDPIFHKLSLLGDERSND